VDQDIALTLEKTQGTVHGSRIPSKSRKEYSPTDLQRVQIWEEKTNEAKMILDANATVLIALRDYYLSLLKNSRFPLVGSSEEDVHIFVAQIDDVVYDCKMQSARAKLLVGITSERKVLVS
jgi:hypothetical protein